MKDASETVTLGPSRATAGLWAAVGLTACTLAGWVVVDSSGHGLAWALLVGCVTVMVPYAAQLVVPARFTWRFEPHALVARSPVRELKIPWASIQLARVVRQAGEPALEVQLDLGDGPQTRLVLLPVGSDHAALHRELRDRLGVAAPAPAPSAGPRAPNGGGHAAGGGQ